MKGFGNIGQLFSQITKIQEKAKEIKESLAEKTVEASAGGDMVTVVMNGKREVVKIKINKEVVNPDDIEMLEDLILAALNQATQKVQQMVAEELSKLTGGLNIPGLSDMADFL